MSASKRRMMDVENVLHPGKTYRVDAEKYEAMRKAYLHIMRIGAPGLSAEQIIERVKPHLPDDLFPNGEKPVGGWRRFSST